MLINVKMPTIFGILTFTSRINFVLSWVEHGKSFITSNYFVCMCFTCTNNLILVHKEKVPSIQSPKNLSSTLWLLMSSNDNLCRLFGPRWAPTKCETQTSNPLIHSLTLYQLSHCAPHTVDEPTDHQGTETMSKWVGSVVFVVSMSRS